MAQQSFYPYPPRISKPKNRPAPLPADWPEVSFPSELDGAAASPAMTRDGSKDSAYYSMTAEAPENPYYQKHSPSPSLYSVGSSGFYNPNALSAQSYQQRTYQDASSSVTRSNPDRTYASRATLKTLGWTETDLANFYKFVIPKGREPYWELVDSSGWEPYSMPQKVFLDSSEHRKNEFPCMFPGCDGLKSFKRPADLERHYRNVHGTPDQKDNFFCDYPHCKERGAFTRKDHFRDHLRDYHKEDIGSMKRSDKKNPQKSGDKKWNELQAAWVAERKIEAKWWRCPKCLDRIQIAESEYSCQTCKHPCEPERMERIENVRAMKLKPSLTAPASSLSIAREDYYGYATPGSTSTYSASGTCFDCGGTGCVVSAGSWEPCLSCQAPGDQYYSDDPRWDSGSYASSSKY